MKRLLCLVLILGGLLPAAETAPVTVTLGALPAELVQRFGALPIQHRGRIKPLDTVARSHLLAFSGKSSIRLDERRVSASEFLLLLMAQRPEVHAWPIFQIHDPDLLVALQLQPRAGNRYAYRDLEAAVAQNQDFIHQSAHVPEAERNLVQQHMLQTWERIAAYQDMFHAAGCLLPYFEIRDPGLATDFGVESGSLISFRRLLEEPARVQAMLEALKKAETNLAAPRQQELFAHLRLLEHLRTRATQAAALIPPPATVGSQAETWLAPWWFFEAGGRRDDAESRAFLQAWEELLGGVLLGEVEDAHVAVQELQHRYQARPDVAPGRLRLEQVYNRRDPFQLSIALYLCGLLLLLPTAWSGNRWWRRLALAAVAAAAAVHLGGMGLRMLILQRPPVGTLYEAILFTGLIGALTGVVIECLLKNRLGIVVAGSIGTVLQLIGLRYAGEGDTMGMLVAVLNSNFWLTTHVLTIVAAYGFAYAACLLGHIALLQACWRGRMGRQLQVLAHAATVFALFFTLVGTVLGGIWADQSWGRFWGWDPKENGALWIVMWLLFCLHARLSGVVGMVGFAALLSLTGIIVSIAFWGVNLLGIGLHSYGFDNGAFRNLTIYTIGELLLVAVLAWRAGRASRPAAPAVSLT